MLRILGFVVYCIKGLHFQLLCSLFAHSYLSISADNQVPMGRYFVCLILSTPGYDWESYILEDFWVDPTMATQNLSGNLGTDKTHVNRACRALSISTAGRGIISDGLRLNMGREVCWTI